MTAEFAVICDSAGTIHSITAVLAHLLGYIPDELVGHSFREFVTLSGRRQLVHDWARIVSGDEAEIPLRMVLRARDGDLLPVFLDVTPLGRGEYLLSYQGAARGRQQLAALNAVLSGLSGSLKLSQVFDLILEQVIQVVPGESSVLHLMRGNQLMPVRARGSPLEELRKATDNWLGLATIRHVYDTRRPLIINDCARDARWCVLPGGEQIRSWIGIPLLHKGELCGVLEVMANAPDRFTIADASAALLFAQQAAAAIRHAQLYRAARVRAARLASINAIGLATTRLELANVIRLISEQVLALMKADIFYIALYDAETNRAQFTEFYDQGHWQPNNEPLALTGLIGYVIRRRETLFISDAVRDNYPTAALDIGTGEDPRTIVIVPLITHEEVIGVLSVQSYHPNKWSRADVKMLETIGSQTAVTIRNAQLYDAATTWLDTLTSLQRSSAQLVGRLDIPAILDLTAREMLQMLAPDEVRLYLTDSTRNRSTARDHTPQVTLALVRRSQGADPSGGVSIRSSVIKRVLAHTTSLILDLTHPEALAEVVEASPDGVQPYLWVGYPIRRANQTYGVATLLYTRFHRFQADEGRMLSLLLTQTANALENAQHAADMSNRLNELSALYQVADKISGKLDLDVILHDVTQTLYTIFPCRICMIAMYDPETDRVIRLRALTGLPLEVVRDLEFHLDKSLFGQVIQSMQSLYIPDLRRVTVEHLIDDALRSALLVPLTVHNRTFGVLAIASSVYEAFTPNHERILKIVAAQIAAAIDNARLYEETHERAQRLAEANHELQALDQLRTELVQNLSHELRGPLTFVKGYAGLLRTEDLGPVNQAQVDALELIEGKADMIARLVADLMMLETLDARDLHVERLNLARLITQNMEGARLSRRDTALRFEIDLDTDLLPVNGDPDRLNQVFDNLIGNAAKFSPQGGVISARAWEEDRVCRVSISDVGIGIPPDALPHIFERFYQGDDTTRHRFGGAGLGLSIVKRIVEAHGGHVTVESKVGVGSVFTVHLPHADSSEALYIVDQVEVPKGTAHHA